MPKNTTLRCIHRHTVQEHPKCFAKGLIKGIISESEWKREGQPWYTLPGTRIGYFDLETTGFDADWNFILSWAIKEKDGITKTDVITRDEIFAGKEDERLIRSFIDEIKKYNIIVGYYSDRFDLPFARSRALYYDIDFPGYGELYHWDLFYTVRSKLKISKNSLANVCGFLGIDGKTPLDRSIWKKARIGDKKALENVVIHNIGDVEILEKLHDKLEFSRKWLRRSV